MRFKLVRPADSEGSEGADIQPVQVVIDSIHHVVGKQLGSSGLAIRRNVVRKIKIASAKKVKYFVGMTWNEIAEITGDSIRTLGNRWAYARSWLHAEIQQELKGEV